MLKLVGKGTGLSLSSPSQSSSMDAVDTVRVVDSVLSQTASSSSSSQNDTIKLIGAIDQGTSSTRFLLFTQQGEIAAWAQMEHTQIFPPDHPGWHEHDPLQIWNNVVTCIDAVVQAMDKQSNYNYSIAAIGITNQRESTVAWNAQTGKPYYNAIVWDDTRTTSVAHHIANAHGGGNVDKLRPQTGLPISSYFAGTKCKWLLDNVEQLQKDMMSQPHNIRFGTIDTWLLYQLTGTPTEESNNTDAANVGGVFLTDATNASRWLFLDLETVQWDPRLVDTVCSPHRVPLSALPTVMPSSHVYATLKKESTGIERLDGVPVASILGDQQAALFGQAAFEPGEAKNTYGTGMFLMMNTGTKPVPSQHGLLTTIAYQLDKQKTVYALEGSVSHSGSTIQWLRDQLQMISTASDSEKYATPSNDGLYLVPAFAGLFAPHWRSDARGCIVGITAAHHKGHILRAALEAAAYQARELFDAIYADSHVLLKSLKVDGGGTHNTLLMQFQADMINAPVVIPKVQETTAMGAAMAAGLAVGIWKDQSELRAMWQVERTFQPTMKESERQYNWLGWKRAVSKSLNWVETDGIDDHDMERFLDAETFTDDDDEYIAAVTGTYPKGYRVSVSSLLTIAAVGAGIGFVLGRRK
ncbi:glycerol kinase [Nitzschia inconspicua]|uniref:glycerol kinase n=1 Tax=Nitzschia inconspicua TaxID=303405 RepID=A0A9K3KG34_9STRA|nr:glycerol kinase [Nitzschia inconspicua]